MKLTCVVIGFVLTGLAHALCPYAEQALKDPQFLIRHVEEQNTAKEDTPKEKRQSGPGNIPFTTFNQNQLVDVTGSHAWVAPGPNDIRGPCPGLNALANHGYFPHNGVVSLPVGASATEQVYGLASSFGVPLTVYATLVDGDVVGDTWSIGGKQPQTLTSPILGAGDGLSGSHNKYESDSSVSRGDYYLYNGDVSSVRVEKFKSLYDLQKNVAVPNYNLDVLIQHRQYTFTNSESTNPYFFSAPFAGLAVANAAHTFVPALMSNHSAEYPNGILDKETLKSFFAITEAPDGTLSWTPGHERIPDNWYRRPLGAINEYSPVSFAQDFVQLAAAVPDAATVGGNTGTVNSFTGVDLGDITGGAYRTTDLLNPTKFVCYFYQLTLALVPDFLRSEALGSALAGALNLLQTEIDSFVDPSCAKIANYNDTFAAQFPGAAVGQP
ncbi:hypothetical protein ABVK25_011842 [Lepraria finkii]|uniref:Heme haloperoxidase family profile domain-containing protein n=1 Tax=Lepraria finkii TaxID=1340010 RepID=A0ABR4AMY8_9LECA